jgi:hypothetical protein
VWTLQRAKPFLQIPILRYAALPRSLGIMATKGSSEVFVNFYQTTRRHIPEDKGSPRTPVQASYLPQENPHLGTNLSSSMPRLLLSRTAHRHLHVTRVPRPVMSHTAHRDLYVTRVPRPVMSRTAHRDLHVTTICSLNLFCPAILKWTSNSYALFLFLSASLKTKGFKSFTDNADAVDVYTTGQSTE